MLRNTIAESMPNIRALALALAGLSLAACHAQPSDLPYSPPNVEDPARLDTSLISHMPCPPPCWQGITPGVSSVEDAIRALEKAPFIDADSIDRESWYGHDGWEIMKWRSSISDLRSSVGTILINGGTVSFIRLTLEYKLELQELVDIMGDPQGYLALEVLFPEGPYNYQLDFLWLAGGLAAKISFVADEQIPQHQQILPPDRLVIGQVAYFPPAADLSEYLHAADTWGISARNYQEWQGFDAITMP